MNLYNDVDAPSIEPAVLARLKRLDNQLCVTFSKFVINPLTSIPLECNPGPDWEPQHLARVADRGGSSYLLEPSFHLWAKAGDGRWYHVMQYLAEGGFGHREVESLEADAARTMRPSDIVEAIRRGQHDVEERRQAAYRERHDDTSKANEGRIRDLIFHDKSGVRQAKIASYPGQVNRSTPGDLLMDAKEDGWDLPEQPE